MGQDLTKKAGFRDFPLIYWISIMFEFFERGAYYGMMSVLSIYLTEQLGFSKEGVGVIKGTIQPLLYFLPILSGAIADRLGYRKTLMVAFSLMGLGYFLTSQTTEYFAVFASLVIMGFGAGTFKPSNIRNDCKSNRRKNKLTRLRDILLVNQSRCFLIPDVSCPLAEIPELVLCNHRFGNMHRSYAAPHYFHLQRTCQGFD